MSINEAWRVEAAMVRMKHPKHLLFLCVANSVRSQMAEGIARSLAPSDILISSAGSQPSQVRPEAVAVLKEIGIDISSQRSKGSNEIDAESVDVVITLCAEEVCPVFLRPVLKIHWGLPDPASITETNDRPQAFREIRDELLKRLSLIFG